MSDTLLVRLGGTRAFRRKVEFDQPIQPTAFEWGGRR